MARRRKNRRTLTQIMGRGPKLPETPAPTAPATLHVIAYGPDGVDEKHLSSAEELRGLDLLRPVTWVNVFSTSEAQVIRALGDIFKLHTLALEDAVHIGQRPKVEDYDDHAYLVLPMPRQTDALDLEQISLFVGKNFVVTVLEDPGDCLDSVRARIREKRGSIRDRGADYLAYAIIDTIIDQYFPILEGYSDVIEALELELVEDRGREVMQRIHLIRHDLLVLRRVMWPVRDALGTILRGEIPQFQEQTSIFMRDCHDHAARLIDITDASREVAGGLVDLYLSMQNARMTEVMKVLTLIATIFIPLSFIASVYGMNFATDASPLNMPELHWRYGYLFALGIMGLMACGMLIYFRRKGWLGPKARRRK